MSSGSFPFKELCCLFCCPPLPSRIAAKIAFVPPAQASYAFHEKSDSECSPPIVDSYPTYSTELLSQADFQFSAKDSEKFVGFKAKTKRGNTIACMYMPLFPNAQTILFSHGNAVDMGQMTTSYYNLGSRLGCNIFTYDYSGYGLSTGQPLETNLYADIQAAWDILRFKLNVPACKIILYGQSIGTVPTCHLSQKVLCAGVVLHSPLSSGLRIAFSNHSNKNFCFDVFKNIEKVPHIKSLVLIIHGTNDEVISFTHGRSLYGACEKAVTPLWVEGGGHNDIELYPQYIERLEKFIKVEIKNNGILAKN